MSEVKRESPLIGQPEAIQGANAQLEGGVILREVSFLGHIILRGQSDDTAFTRACSEVLGIELPTTPNTQVQGSGVVVCWLRPTEWLILTEDGACQEWIERLQKALGDIHSGVVDVSGGQTLIQIQGQQAMDTLSKGATLDLHPRSLGANQCARTLMAKTTVMIRVAEPGQAFDLVVRRSFADHLWRWLRDAAEEYGCVVRPAISSLEALTE